MRKNTCLYYVLLAMSIIVSSCDEGDDIWSQGAKLEMSSAFSIKDATSDTISVDFTASSGITFEGSWNVETPWEIVIVGDESGVSDTITGTSSSLDGVTWSGSVSSSQSYFPYTVLNKTFSVDLFSGNESSEGGLTFTSGETCTITLSFPDYVGVDTCKTILKIAEAQEISYSKSDFCVFGDWENDNYTPLYQDETITKEKSGQLVAPEGVYYCLMQGEEPGGSWYIAGGAFTFNKTSGWSQPSGVYPISLQDTATTYINFFMYGYPGFCERSSLFIALASGETEADLTGDRIMVSEGWHGISIPISRFVSKTDFDYDSVDKIIFSLFSDGNEGSIKTAVDCFVLTKKSPLFPIYQ